MRRSDCSMSTSFPVIPMSAAPASTYVGTSDGRIVTSPASPNSSLRSFERTGRQAEIVEVKGSVELAPLTGLVDAIVDLTATGTTLRENGLVIREQLFTSTARLIANPVAYRLKAAAIDDVVTRLR